MINSSEYPRREGNFLVRLARSEFAEAEELSELEGRWILLTVRSSSARRALAAATVLRRASSFSCSGMPGNKRYNVIVNPLSLVRFEAGIGQIG